MRVVVSKPSGSGFAVHWTALIGRRQGFYAGEGLDVEIVELNQADGTAALLSGEAPIMRRGPDEAIALIAQGAPLRVIAGLIRKSPIYLYASDDVRTIGDLRGRTIAGISARFGSSLVLRMLLEDEGLSIGEYEIIHVGGSYMSDLRRCMQAARRRRSFRRRPAGMPKTPDTHCWQACRTVTLNCYFPLYKLRMHTLRRAATSCVRLLKAEIRAQRWLTDPANKTQAVTHLSEADALSFADDLSTFETMVEGDRVFSTDGEIDDPELQILIDTMTRFGDIKAPLSIAGCFDRRYLDEARRQLSS